MATPSNPLFEALDAGGFIYNIRHSASGTSYAGFRWAATPSSELEAFTALWESSALRLTLYEPLGPGVFPGALECLACQSDLPIARLYLGADPEQKLELTVGVPVDGAVLDFSSLRALLLHLRACADDVSGKPTGASRQPPLLPGSRDQVPLENELKALGLISEEDAGASFDLELPGLEVVSRFTVYHLGTGWLRVAAHLSHDERLSLDRISPELVNRLQIWAPTGRFVSTSRAGQRHLGCEVSIPFLGRPTSQVVADSVRAAIQLLGTAYKQVCQDAGV